MTTRARRPAISLLGLLATLISFGCSNDGPTRYPLTGRVTFAGEPVPTGMLLLSPDTAGGNRGPASVAEIHNGRYALDASQGVVGGPYRVRVLGYDGQAIEIPGEGISPTGQTLFPPYETQVELPHAAGTADFEVPQKSA